MQWYYIVRGQQTGPISEEALFAAARDGRLQPGDHVWNTSMGDQWAEARTVPGLFAPPPLPAEAPAPPPDEPALAPAWQPGAPLRLSCWLSAQRAWERTRDTLFRPIDLGKWFALGFSAWLATLGEQGGSFNPLGGGEWQESAVAEWKRDPAAALEHLHQKFLAHASVIIGVGSVVVLIMVAVGLVLLWLRCRGKFMFLDNVVNDRVEIAYPWRTFRQHGTSLFAWALVFGLVGLAAMSLLSVLGVYTVLLPLLRVHHATGLAPTIALNLSAWFVMVTFFAFVHRFLEDFVIPIMYNENKTATEAWTRFLGLLGANFPAFVWYGLCYLLWVIAVDAIVGAVVLLTCCTAACLMILPYIGAVVLLPATMFFRCFSLEYLAQFGPAFEMRRDAGGGR